MLFCAPLPYHHARAFLNSAIAQQALRRLTTIHNVMQSVTIPTLSECIQMPHNSFRRASALKQPERIRMLKERFSACAKVGRQTAKANTLHAAFHVLSWSALQSFALVSWEHLFCLIVQLSCNRIVEIDGPLGNTVIARVHTPDLVRYVPECSTRSVPYLIVHIYFYTSALDFSPQIRQKLC